MGGLFRFLVVALIATGAILFIISEVFKFSTSIFGFNRRLAKDINALRKAIANRQLELIPLDDEELKIISGNISAMEKNHRFEGFQSTVINSIYNEHLAVVAHKFYEDQDQGVLLCKTSDSEWVFVYKKGSTKIYLNGKHKYNFAKGALKSKDSKVLVSLNKTSNSNLKVNAGELHLASIDMEESDSEFSKLFSFFKPQSTVQREYVFISALIYLFELD